MAIDKDMYLAYDKWKRENQKEVGSDSWFAFRAGWLACKAAQPRVQLTGGTCAACGEGNVVYDGCCINCGVPATSN